MLSAVLFDLDGTLLPMDQDVFTQEYFRLLAAKAAPYGYEPRTLVDAVWKGTAAMVTNDGSRTDEEAFWGAFAAIYGEEKLADRAIFDDFYRREFEGVRAVCGYAPEAAETVRAVREAGLRVILATNPIFPREATMRRIRWAGLSPADFELITTYENTCFCKPNPAYYRDIASRCGLDPAACLMVGNDAAEDGAAALAGMRVFLLTDCLINKKNADLAAFPHGGFADLAAFLRTQL